MHKTVMIAAFAALLSLTCAHAQEITDKDIARAEDLVARMTLDEKMEYVTEWEGIKAEVTGQNEVTVSFDVKTHEFVVEPGEFVISVGGSSADLPLKTSVTL